MRHRTASRLLVLAISLTTAAALPAARGDVVFWDGSSSDLWSVAANWNTASDGSGLNASPLNNDILFHAPPGQRLTTNVLDINLAINSLTFGNGGSGDVIINNGGQTLTINGAAGITVDLGYNVRIDAPIALGTSQTWTNNATQAVYTYGTINLGSHSLTTAGTGHFEIKGDISGTGGFTKTGVYGEVGIAGNNSFTGTLAIDEGNLNVASIDSLGLGTTITMGRPGESGFVVLRYDGGSATMTQNIYAYSTTASTLRNYGGGVLTLAGNATFNGTIFTLRSNTFQVNGQLIGSGGGNSEFRVYGSTVYLNNSANSYDGATNIFSGGRLLNGVNNALPTTTVLSVGDHNDTGVYNTNGYNQQLAGLVLDGTWASTLVVQLTSAGVIDQINTASISSEGTTRTLQVDLVGGMPAFTVGQSFQIFTNPGSWGGAGSAFTDFILPGDYAWDTSQLGVDGSIRVTAVVPEPGAFVLGLMALTPALALWFRRGRRAATPPIAAATP